MLVKHMINIRRNATWNLLEVILSTLSQFIIFKLIIAYLGISFLGVWSLVFATLSFAKVADVGIAAGLVYFVARPAPDEADAVPVLGYVETALVMNFVLFVTLGVIIFYPAYLALGLTIHGVLLQQAHRLLPYAIISFVLFNLTGVLQSSLVGFNRSDLKSKLTVSSLFLQLGVSILAIRSLGLIGLALALVLRNLYVAFVGWILVIRTQPTAHSLRPPYRFNRVAFREMFRFGIHMQGLTIANLLYEPVTKFAFSAVAGPAALGLYEIASRLVLQTRALVMAPTQNLTPMFASLVHSGKETIYNLYQRSLALLCVATFSASILIVLCSPLVSLLLLKHVQRSYMLWVAILSVGWFFNTAAVPSYLMGIGIGKLSWNLIGNLTGTFCSLILTYSMGTLFGTVGLVSGAALAAGIGGITIMIGNCKTAAFESPMPSSRAMRSAFAQLKREAFARI